ncbi:o-succinylbenzoate synthase [Elizabethkingia meningoseptica]|uniref:O-succinylbenzoate synthase n=1 Tax=Elizabethkingia meningoseptica TaxID=238 RepID=A0A1V3TWL7_ELIME|nr:MULTISPECIES: o-succinylbenzoate synthase [Elizabethkingia]AQX05128.1 o-succinylbenzoate synthase [Elizabethkingia meningoseptica]AQX12648.1 o-succinylbenzoate synthase [Elizabethkingia meningoseptica]AQX47172.1 o-succinylbenzoate synthase [Elizabethkingia meningoseptica]EJK5330463.1 o-succinylbenzoate synthase [Elizabethkingia meningoseptica]KUY17853.1 o-succinylbenzoate synthase [Elizabethkingia meningoseptica]
MQAEYQRHQLIFKRPGGTSRGVLTEKETYFLYIRNGEKKGTGECGIFRGLSYDDVSDYEEKLQWLCDHINDDYEALKQQLLHYPSIWFGYEQAMQNLKYGDHIYFPSDFTEGRNSITINGLIWMGNVDFMKEQIEYKLEEKFKCIKLKIGVNWDEEKKVIDELRKTFPKNQLELRVDANGAFSVEKAKVVLDELASLDIHSIEQPIKAGNWQDMAVLCAQTPTPIALDEELIGIIDPKQKQQLLETILPQYIILKPSLVGGYSGSDEWIALAERNNIDWWITSALESNIGLNAIAQYTYTKKNPMPQGLGTGALFTNNTPSDLELKGDQLWFAN